ATIDGTCETGSGNNVCTLHAAIEEANAAPGSTINFSSQLSITDCSLPLLTGGNTTIDAHAQWNGGLAYGTPGVSLVHPFSCGPAGTILTIDSSSNHIYGLRFVGDSTYRPTGLAISSGSGNVIGSDVYKYRNVFVLTGKGVYISDSNNNIVSGNYFGTEQGTSVAGSSQYDGTHGVYLYNASSANNQIINNLIVGQSTYGIYLSGSGNVVDQNIIGLDINTTSSLPNYVGIVIEYGSNDISQNTIGSNNHYGIWLAYNANNNDIHNNAIGHNFGQGNQSHGINISSNNSGNIIRGNTIRYNNGSGIYALGTSLNIHSNTINSNGLHGIHCGSTATGVIGGGDISIYSLYNTIISNTENGILLDGSSSVTISANLIGLTVGGLESGNLFSGISMANGAHDNVIGGNTAAKANWIGGNSKNGIELIGNTTTKNKIRNNIIGARVGFNWPAANGYNGIAVYQGAYDNQIGFPGAGNTILSSTLNGIMISSSNNNWVYDNRIGTDGTHNWGNTQNGIYILQSNNTYIWQNKIGYNSPSSPSFDGIRIDGSSAIANKMTVNSIYNNGGEGIKLLNGANQSIMPPVISRVGHTISGTACSTCNVEIFSDSKDEGRFFEGTVGTDTSGNFSWTGDVQGRFITATAIDYLSKDTSIFSTPIPAPFPWSMFMPSIIGGHQ
ncbi:MAG: right-handed parallel beta-helix repeat-containing protein, partial [Desulfobulbaceae bacterium]|nr:right-handed parallel beta-helix repeat-containing protein [Desulfobulbaceae bacterium]